MGNIKLVDLIHEALKSQKNEQRRLAQKQIILKRKKLPNEFFLQCASLIVNQKQDDFIRQSASTLIISSIRAKQNKVYFWDHLQHNTRQSVKDQMLNTLVDPNSMIMKSGANVISHIAAIQIPRNEWLDLVDILAQNTRQSDVNVRKASIITIGSICQQLNQAAVKIQYRACQQFLGGILIGIQQKDDASIIQQSMKALRNSLSFLTPILSQQTYRNEVFRIIYQKIKISNEDHLPYEALFQFCKNCYQYLHPYLQLIIQMVTAHLKQKNDNTISALQLLDTIGSQYLSRTQDAQDRTNISKNKFQNYLLPLQGDILTYIIKCLYIQNKRQQNFSELRNSAAQTLSTFASIGNKQTVDIIANSAAACLKEQNLGRQQATAVLLSTLCENPNRQYVVQMITNAFEHVLNLLNSNNQKVVLNTLNGLITISQFFPFIFYNHPNVTTIINKFFQIINPKKPTITMAVIMIFKNITQNIEQNCVLLRQHSILLTKIVNWYQKLLEVFEGLSKDYAQRLVLIIRNCLVKLKNRQIILYMIEFVMDKYYFYYDPQVSDQSQRLCSLACIVHQSILAFKNMMPEEGLIDNLCNLIDKHLNFFGIQQRGLNMISAMAITFDQAFLPKTEKYCKYLEGGLDLISQPCTFKAAVSSIGDFNRVYDKKFIPKELHILDKILILIHKEFDRETKLNILGCIADLVLNLGQSAEPYLQRIIQVANICFQAVYQLLNNPDQRNYVDQLKRRFIDMYACLTFSINDDKHKKKSLLLFYHFPNVVTFVVRTCQRSQNPTIDYIIICLQLLFGSAKFYCRQINYKDNFKKILQSEQVKNLVKILDNFKERGDIRQLQLIIKNIYEDL